MCCDGQAAAEQEVAALSWGEFKPRLTDAVIAHLEPLQQRYAQVRYIVLPYDTQTICYSQCKSCA